MTDVAPERFRLLATHVAGRPLDVAEAAPGVAAHTDGLVIFVSAGASPHDWRREVLVQAALLGAGSLDTRLLKGLRGRPSVARRYLALEGRRVLCELGSHMSLAAVLVSRADVVSGSADDSLAVARGRSAIEEPPSWFGVIRPSRMLRAPAGASATDADARREFRVVDAPDEDDDAAAEKSRILRLFDVPTASTTVSDFLRKVLGRSRSGGADHAGGETSVGTIRRARAVGSQARPPATPIRFTDGDRPGAAVGVGGALHPEWDVFAGRYRPDWCRVIDYPMTASSDVSAGGTPHDAVLRGRLARVGLTYGVLRRRSDGDDLDTDALIDFVVGTRSGHSPAENVYAERRRTVRELGVLILLDASGSTNDGDAGGHAVHDRQRRAAATLAATLEELGDRVAVYAFRSRGRHAVHLPAIKTFDQRFGMACMARVNQLRPSGYTRLGAGVRGAGAVLKRDAGTPRRLLVVLSDGVPYDEGYEGRYAEADARRALDELRADGVACLCLSVGATTPGDDLERVFGSAGRASAPTLGELSPQMDALFLSSLRELSAPRSRTPKVSST